MGKTSSFVSKDGPAIFGRRVPGSSRKTLESPEICVRLGVTNKDSAERRAHWLAVVVDAFFEAASEQMLTASELKSVIDLTMTQWREDDQRRDAETEIRLLGAPVCARDDAVICSEMADDLLFMRSSGENAHEPD